MANQQYDFGEFDPTQREPLADPQQDPLAPAAKPAGTYNRDALSQAIQGIQFSGNSQYNPTDFIAQHQGDFAQGVQNVGTDKIRLPDGELVDIGGNIGANGRGGAWWGSEKDWQRDNAASGGAMQRAEDVAYRGGGGGGGSSASASSSSTSGAGVDPEMRAALLRLIGRSEPSQIDPLTDPNLAPQARAYSDARQRGSDAERAKLAERASFEGLNSGGAGSGAFTGGLADIYQRQGQDIAGQQAGLVGNEVQSRRSDLINALQIANSIGARDQASQIQTQLAGLDNQYKYAALGQNQNQFNDQYGLNLAQLQQNSNRDAYLSALGQGY